MTENNRRWTDKKHDKDVNIWLLKVVGFFFLIVAVVILIKECG